MWIETDVDYYKFIQIKSYLVVIVIWLPFCE